ncbi:MAG: FKBP-type peptidyl-prolyl cis-trans isomerase [Pseudomonadota bacterium]
MKLTLPVIAAFVALLSLSACGGGSSSSTPVTDNSQPQSLVKTDTSVGTGTEAVSGKRVTVNYTGWLYSATAAGYKGLQFDTSAGRGPFSFTLGAGAVIAGWDQGVVGMKVGGKRTLIIPSSLGYGVGGYGSIPGNAGLVFEVELLSVQ